MGVKYSGTIERMRLAGKLKNDSALARALEISPQALTNFKKRGELPADLVLRFAQLFEISLNWLITGEGEMRPSGGKYGNLVKIERELMVSLSREELSYVGKLIHIMRSDKDSTEAIKNAIDAFLKAAQAPVSGTRDLRIVQNR